MVDQIQGVRQRGRVCLQGLGQLLLVEKDAGEGQESNFPGEYGNQEFVLDQ